MPAPRSMSGQARGDQSDPAGQLTVRVTYDDFQDTPAGVPVALVGYSADDTTSYQVQVTDNAGRAQFRDLDRSGGTSYFAMTELPRNGAIDRLTSEQIVLDSQLGVRLVLSSEKRSSTAPVIDDFAKLDPAIETPAGKVRVVLDGLTELAGSVTLIDAASHKPLGEVKPQASPPDPSQVRATPQFTADPSLPAGTLEVAIVGGAGQAEDPLKDVAVRVIPASSNEATGGLSSVTGNDGTVRMALQSSVPQKVVLTINGRQLVSEPIDLSKSGGKLMVRAQWEDSRRPQAMFDVPATDGQVVYAEVTSRKQRYRSMPLQLRAASGSKVTIYLFPRIMFRFQLDAEVEDELFAVRGRFEVTNYSFSPYRGGPDGMVVALPRGFKGAVIADNDQAEVAVAPGEGFRIIRPIPPGGRQFHAAFSLPVEAGTATWALDLPLGTFDSELVIRQTPNMVVHTPPSFQGESKTVPQGTFFVLAPLRIQKGQSMAMTIEGLPSPPRWRAWAPTTRWSCTAASAWTRSRRSASAMCGRCRRGRSRGGNSIPSATASRWPTSPRSPEPRPRPTRRGSRACWTTAGTMSPVSPRCS
jgi:hypothetical protein